MKAYLIFALLIPALLCRSPRSQVFLDSNDKNSERVDESEKIIAEWQDIDLNKIESANRQIFDVALESLVNYAKGDGFKFDNYDIVRTEEQMVAGLNVRYTLTLHGANGDKKVIGTVWVKPWEDRFEVTDFQEL
mmetsp:Transcript_25965/g.22900  ORF Transcript_25965/g.22900 Transcript_25965/m.22900 type:complete len:134 (+) Transcript_25965:85-486(+)